MRAIWRFLKRKVLHKKRPVAPTDDVVTEDDGMPSVAPAIKEYGLDSFWQPLTKEEIMADLAVHYEDSGETEAELETPDGADIASKSEKERRASAKVCIPSDSIFSTGMTTYSTATVELAEPMSRIWMPHRSTSPIDDNERGLSNLEAGSESAKRSYMSIIPTTIQVLNDKTTFFVWLTNFHPAIGRRFSSVRVSVKFTPAPEDPNALAKSKTSQALRSSHPTVLAHAPHKSFGATSSEQRSIAWGLALPMTVPTGPISIGVTPSGQSETKKEVQHAFTITGSARGTPSRHTCVWTVEENGSTERGIPSELQLAALVQHESEPLMMEIDIEGRTAGGYLPSHDLRPKTTAMGRKKIVNPSKFKDILFEFEFGSGDHIVAARHLLDRWTGKVDGAVLEFDQPQVRA